MNEQFIEIVLALFWAGFVGLNLWLWKSAALEQTTVEPAAAAHTGINDKEMSQGEHHATVHH